MLIQLVVCCSFHKLLSDKYNQPTACIVISDLNEDDRRFLNQIIEINDVKLLKYWEKVCHQPICIFTSCFIS